MTTAPATAATLPSFQAACHALAAAAAASTAARQHLRAGGRHDPRYEPDIWEAEKPPLPPWAQAASRIRRAAPYMRRQLDSHLALVDAALAGKPVQPHAAGGGGGGAAGSSAAPAVDAAAAAAARLLRPSCWSVLRGCHAAILM